jgi:thymidylate kinase
MNDVIIEGVTGAGKTSTIKALASLTRFNLINEDATFDGFMAAFLVDTEEASRRARHRLESILDRIEASDQQPHLLERFHYSQLALGSSWKWYRDLDDRCAALGYKIVVLVLPEEHLALRSLYRAEYEGKDWQGFIQRFGSEERALDAIRRSQQTRLEAVEESRVQSRLIDASGKDWKAYAKSIAEGAGWATDPIAGTPKP